MNSQILHNPYVYKVSFVCVVANTTWNSQILFFCCTEIMQTIQLVFLYIKTVAAVDYVLD